MVKDVNEHNRVSQDLETYESIESNQNKAKEPRLNWDSSFKGGLSGIFEKIFLPIGPTNNQSNLSDPTLDPKCHEMLYRPLAAWFHDFKSMINHEKT